MRLSTLYRLTVAAMLALLVAMPIDQVVARGPDLRLRPNDGLAGETVTARGKDFPVGVTGTIAWGDLSRSFGEFTVGDDGSFKVDITVPDLPPGDYTVSAITPNAVADDTFTIEVGDDATTPPAVGSPVALGTPVALSSELAPNRCAEDLSDATQVANAAELEAALAAVKPGEAIELAAGTYRGNFVAAVDGTVDDQIALCGPREAVIDGGDWGASGYALHLEGDYWTVGGITVTNAQKGIVADGVTGVAIDGVEVHTIGHEAVHFRTNSTENTIQNSDIHDTGLDNQKFGEGVYLGTAVSNWSKYTDGEPDRSDRNRVLNNRFWNTSSESIDIKEGTEGGLIEGNVFDGSGLTGADSWVDVKGNGYVIRGNTGTNSPQDGFQTHVIDDMEWGTGNEFEGNVANVNGPGVGFYIHQPDSTANVVACSNVVNGADGGVTNLESGCNG